MRRAVCLYGSARVEPSDCPLSSTAESELKDIVALHAFRIQGKHVRYAMEIFAGAFDEAFRSELYPQVESLQERLGAINDHVTADAYLVQWHAETDSDGLRKAIEIARRREQGSMEKLQQEFLDWWTPERRARLCACLRNTCNGPSRPHRLRWNAPAVERSFSRWPQRELSVLPSNGRRHGMQKPASAVVPAVLREAAPGDIHHEPDPSGFLALERSDHAAIG